MWSGSGPLFYNTAADPEEGQTGILRCGVKECDKDSHRVPGIWAHGGLLGQEARAEDGVHQCQGGEPPTYTMGRESYSRKNMHTHEWDWGVFLATTVKLRPRESGLGSNPDSEDCEGGFGASPLPNVQFPCLQTGKELPSFCMFAYYI